MVGRRGVNVERGSALTTLSSGESVRCVKSGWVVCASAFLLACGSSFSEHPSGSSGSGGATTAVAGTDAGNGASNGGSGESSGRSGAAGGSSAGTGGSSAGSGGTQNIAGGAGGSSGVGPDHPIAGSCSGSAEHIVCGPDCTPCTGPTNSTSHCDGVICSYTCNPGFHKCGTGCTRDDDATACGSACVACVATAPHSHPSCASGVCQSACDTGYPECTAPDHDGDGIPDASDNCPDVSNDTQLNTDGDALGDSCDPDLDGDGIPNAADDCVMVPNPTQHDLDGDGIGFACDTNDEIVARGTLMTWPESMTQQFDMLAGAHGSGIPATWSVSGATLIYVYARVAGLEVASPGFTTFDKVTNADSLTYTTDDVMVSAGTIAVFRNVTNGTYAALRFESASNDGQSWFATMSWLFAGHARDFSRLP
jgi:hypothetical protein